MLKRLQVLAILFSFFHCCLQQRRIYNGDTAKQKQFPYIVNVRGPMTCGGALLNKKYVLTAGHCLMDAYDNEEVTVILGAHNYYDNGEKGRVRLKSRKYWKHEKFTFPSAENDIAIVELPEEVTFTDSIQPIKISTKENIENEKDLIVVLAGWGLRNGEHMPAEHLQTARMKLISHDACVKFKDYYVEKVTKNNICAMGYENQPGKAIMPCDGDSGSPLVLASTQELIGVTSFIKDAENGTSNGNDCKTEKAPAVFVRIAPYLNWITEKTGIKF